MNNGTDTMSYEQAVTFAMECRVEADFQAAQLFELPEIWVDSSLDEETYESIQETLPDVVADYEELCYSTKTLLDALECIRDGLTRAYELIEEYEPEA
jgi:hypothetical protein